MRDVAVSRRIQVLNRCTSAKYLKKLFEAFIAPFIQEQPNEDLWLALMKINESFERVGKKGAKFLKQDILEAFVFLTNNQVVFERWLMSFQDSHRGLLCQWLGKTHLILATNPEEFPTLLRDNLISESRLIEFMALFEDLFSIPLDLIPPTSPPTPVNAQDPYYEEFEVSDTEPYLDLTLGPFVHKAVKSLYEIVWQGGVEIGINAPPPRKQMQEIQESTGYSIIRAIPNELQSIPFYFVLDFFTYCEASLEHTKNELAGRILIREFEQGGFSLGRLLFHIKGWGLTYYRFINQVTLKKYIVGLLKQADTDWNPVIGFRKALLSEQLLQKILKPSDLRFLQYPGEKKGEWIAIEREKSVVYQKMEQDLVGAILLFFFSLGIIDLRVRPLRSADDSTLEQLAPHFLQSIEYYKLTAFGAVSIGLMENIPATPPARTLDVELDDTYLILTLKEVDQHILNALSAFCVDIGGKRYRADLSVLLSRIKIGPTTEHRIDQLEAILPKPLPANWQQFFHQARRDLSFITPLNGWSLYQLDTTNKEALNRFLASKELRELIVLAEGHRFLVPKQNAAPVKKILRNLGLNVNET